jgi:hypothetical protein
MQTAGVNVLLVATMVGTSVVAIVDRVYDNFANQRFMLALASTRPGRYEARAELRIHPTSYSAQLPDQHVTSWAPPLS